LRDQRAGEAAGGTHCHKEERRSRRMRTGGGKDEAVSRDTRRLQSQPDEGERPALWDPANAWPSGRRLIWALLATSVLVAQGPSFLHNIRKRWGGGNDFFQDWTSARNVLEGRPAYLPLSEAAALYGRNWGAGQQSFRVFPGTPIRPRPCSRRCRSHSWIISMQ